jgi:pilus assembly protein CpaF
VVPPLAVDGPCLTIRRFGTTTLPLTAFATEGVAELLRTAVQRGANVVVAGGTGAGKTTLLNALAAEIPPGQRIITIEDAAELRLPQDHVVRLESRPANAEGVGHVTVRDLVRNALRMRPDRIILGECRGGEALDMLQAMNTGHDGSMTTCHANSGVDALRRLETMVLLADVGLPLAAVREHLAATVDLVVHVVRGLDSRRTVASVDEVVDAGAERVRRLADGGRVVAAPTRGRWC